MKRAATACAGGRVSVLLAAQHFPCSQALYSMLGQARPGPAEHCRPQAPCA